jgi:pimeloyl-ACP methyl ester carboxylesterase
MKKVLFGVLAILLSGCSALKPSPQRDPANTGLKTDYLQLKYGDQELDLRIGVQDPRSPILGDVLYIHGFSDRLDNHGPLFDEWSRAGFRVISFDLPSHGENRGSYNDLNNFTFEKLADLVAKVEKATLVDPKRPLILAGWSTGGLLVVRMLQKSWTSMLTRPVSAAILFAPGVSVRKLPWTFGNRLGEVTQSTLTHDPNPPHVGPIAPASPLWSKLIFHFSPDLMLNSALSQGQEYPLSVPTLVFIGGEREDVYAKSRVVRSWVDEQNEYRKAQGNQNIISVQCPHAMHEMDNELPEFGGLEVRRTAALFAADVVKGASVLVPASNSFGSVCRRIDQ